MNIKNLDWEKVDLKPGWEDNFPDIQSILIAGINHATKFRELTRVDISKSLTEDLGIQISEHSINKWTRHDGNGHRFPVEYSMSFAEVTGDPRILFWMATKAGLMCLTPKLEKKFKIFLLKEQEEKIQAERIRLEKELSE